MSEGVLIVDDEVNMRWVLTEALRNVGFEVRSVGSGQEALARMTEQAAHLVILDLKLKGMDGFSILRNLRERWPETVVLMLTAYGTVASAVEAMQLGAADYLRKPFDVEELIFKIQRALERKSLYAEVQRLRQMTRTAREQEPVGSHPIWQRTLEQVRSFSQLIPAFVLVGEPGTGKTLLARWSHSLGFRAQAPLIEVNVQDLTAAQLLTMLTGGRRLVGAGTLVLRHAHVLSSETWEQVACPLLQMADESQPRVVVTSENHPPAGSPWQHWPIVPVPALRSHAEDIAHLIRWFAPDQPFTLPTLQLLEQYSWPGNIAELCHITLRAAALAQGSPVEERHLPERIQQALSPDQPIRLPPEGLHLEAMEISLMRQALERTGGNKTRAAELLGLTRQTLLYRLEKYGLRAPE